MNKVFKNIVNKSIPKVLNLIDEVYIRVENVNSAKW